MRWNEYRLVRVICLALAVVTLALYAQVTTFDFVNFDDSDYVYANDRIKAGLTWSNVGWALTSIHSANWHPLTTLTLMAEYSAFGLNPAAFHLTNVFLHIANTLVLFLLARRLGVKLWPAALAAALFAWHPAHVESVAWVSELKDVLSTLFWLLTTWAYVRYVEEPSKKRLIRALALFALGLMAKPMLVTLPCVLLLLDVWPLRRLTTATVGTAPQPLQGGETNSAVDRWLGELAGWWREVRGQGDRVRQLLKEKVPFVVVTVLACLVTFLVQKIGGATAPLDDFPLLARIANALVSYSRYLEMLVWPVELCVYYPLAESEPGWRVLLAVLLLAVVTWWALRSVRTRPWLAVGWFWYVGTLVPVIGLVQVGAQAMADRYTYVPYIGLFLMLAGALSEWTPRTTANARRLVTLVAVVLLSPMLFLTARQISYWENSKVLFGHALKVTGENPLAHVDLGVAHFQEGQFNIALREFRRALAISPNFYHPPLGLARGLVAGGKLDQAVDLLKLLVRYRKTDTEIQMLLGNALIKQGRYEEAAGHFGAVVKLDPHHVQGLNNLGLALAAQGKMEDAITCYLTAMRENYNFADTHNNLAVAYEAQGKTAEAMEQYALAIKFQPDLAEARGNLGVLLAKQGRLDEAAPHIVIWVAHKPREPQAQFYYGLTLLNEQKTDVALVHLREAIRLRPDWPFALQTVARILATHPDPLIRNGAEAVTLAERGRDLTKQDDAAMLDTLAAAYAEAGRFPDAVSAAERAAALATAKGQSALAAQIQQRLELYRQQKPFHQTGG